MSTSKECKAVRNCILNQKHRAVIGETRKTVHG